MPDPNEEHLPPICEFGEDNAAVSIWEILCSQPDCDHREVLYICAECEENYIKHRIENNTSMICATCNKHTYGAGGTYRYIGAA